MLFRSGTTDALKQSAGVRDGALACLVGIAARKSINSKEPVYIKDLTTITPQIVKEFNKI